jgi:hypothetical protein
MPVTTTIGLPSLSRGADMVPPSMLRRIQKRLRAEFPTARLRRRIFKSALAHRFI